MEAIPNLLGKLMFLNKDSPKQEVEEDYYCLICALFFPWNFDAPLNPDDICWETIFSQQSASPVSTIISIHRQP